MTANRGFTFGKQALALGAALLLGTAILGIPSAQPAYAVVTTPGSGDADGGDQGTEPASRRPRPTPVPVMCTLTRQDGTVEFHEWGAYVNVNGRTFYCTSTGHWMEVKRTSVPSDSTAPGGGVYTQMP